MLEFFGNLFAGDLKLYIKIKLDNVHEIDWFSRSDKNILQVAETDTYIVSEDTRKICNFMDIPVIDFYHCITIDSSNWNRLYRFNKEIIDSGHYVKRDSQMKLFVNMREYHGVIWKLNMKKIEHKVERN